MASVFWVGGAGTWDSTTTTHWSASTGGAGGAPAPVAGDIIIFDASSGGGTVTASATISGIAFGSLTFGAFTGTLDFSANNPNMAFLVVSGTGTGTRTFNMGSGTWTITGGNTVWNFSTTTGLTFNANTSTLNFSGSSTNRTCLFGGKTLNIVGFSSSNGVGCYQSDALTCATLNLTAPVAIAINGGSTFTLTNAFNWNGSTATNLIIVKCNDNSASAATISCASGSCTATWAVFQGITCSGGATFTATSSFGMGTTGITVSGPSGGGGGIIGS